MAAFDATHKAHGTAAGANYVDFSKALFDMYVEREFVKRLERKLVASKTGKPSTLPEKAGKNVRWNFMSSPTSGATTPLAEGEDPTAATEFTLNSVTTAVDEYGAFVNFTKELDIEAVSGTLDEILDALAYHAMLTIDTLYLTESANFSVEVDAGVAMSAEALRRARKLLDDSSAEFHPLTGKTAFLGVFSTEAAYDMLGEGAPTWSQAKNELVESQFRTPFEDTPLGSTLYDTMIKISQNIRINTAAAPDDHLNYIYGADAQGVTSLATNLSQPRVIVTRPEEAVDVVLRNRGRAGWWMLYATKVIDSNRAVEILSDVTGT